MDINISMEDAQLTVENITVSPAPFAPDLFTDFSLKLRPGDVLGILGSNGVGKTTLLKCLSGCLTPKVGNLTFFHRSLIDEINLKKNIGFLPDTVPLIPYFTVQENLSWMAKFRGLSKADIAKAIPYVSERLGLNHWSHILAKHLSLGQRKLVGIAGTLIHQPKLVILDEPLNDLDTQVRERVLEELKTLGKCSIVIFTSHYYRDLATIANKILLLEKGQSRWVLDKSNSLDVAPLAETLPPAARRSRKNKKLLVEKTS
jgi:ABC-2 type transport system ATP-binding protein